MTNQRQKAIEAAWAKLRPLVSHSKTKEAIEAYERAKWQPIASAPRDGSPIDIYANVRRFADCYWHSQAERWVSPHHGGLRLPADVKPTHWHPLPTPPSEEE